jgi:hypothetical protein
MTLINDASFIQNTAQSSSPQIVESQVYWKTNASPLADDVNRSLSRMEAGVPARKSKKLRESAAEAYKALLQQPSPPKTWSQLMGQALTDASD